jgi:hypothetical protein
MSQPIVEKEAGPPAQSETETPNDSSQGEKKTHQYKDFGHDEAKPTRTSSHASFLRV